MREDHALGCHTIMRAYFLEKALALSPLPGFRLEAIAAARTQWDRPLHCYLSSRYSSKHQRPSLPRFPKGGRENKFNIRPIKLNTQAYFISESQPVKRTILQCLLTVSSTERLGQWILSKPNLVHALSLPGALTFFAPTNAALDKLSDLSLRRLRSSDSLFVTVLNTHTVRGCWLMRDLLGLRFTSGLEPAGECEKPTMLTSLSGRGFSVRTTGNVAVSGSRTVFLGKAANYGQQPARLTFADLRCHNGVVHLIDNVIQPNVATRKPLTVPAA